MLTLIVFIAGLLILVVALMAAFAESNPGIALIGVLIFAIATAVSTMGTVDTRNVGVVHSFKRPTGETKDTGLYVKAPWKSVTDMPLNWQNDTHEIKVQTANGPVVTLIVQPFWRLTKEGAPELYQEYRNFDSVRKMFENELRNSANKVFETYNPLTNIDPKTGNPIQNKETLADKLEAELNTRLDSKVVSKGKSAKVIEIKRIALNTVAPDEATQAKIDEQVKEFARSKVLDQQLTNTQKEKLIADKQAEISPELFCMREAIRIGQNPGYCLMGGGSVIVDGTTKK